jgi:plastocyanin
MNSSSKTGLGAVAVPGCIVAARKDCAKAGVRASAFSFVSNEQEPGRNVDVRFPVAGTFEVRCEIHPRMLLTVTVE